MARKTIPLTLAALSVFIATQGHALGLGEITLHSSLNQPLDAEIALLQVGKMSADDLAASLASLADFNKAGVNRLPFLDNLRFTPVIRNGRGYIKVVSTRPVNEPYLNFLLEVARPNGSLLREYTLLLDPPGYSQMPVTPSRSAQFVAAEPRRKAELKLPTRSPLPAGEGRYTTVAKDTLWGIASRLSGKGISHTEMMESLFALNPQAFVNGDPHRLKVGQTLSLPQGQPTQVIAQENPTPAANPQITPAAETTQAANTSSTDKTAATVAAVEANLLSANAQRELLNRRLDEMQEQIKTLQADLQKRDAQIERLMGELARRDSANREQTAPLKTNALTEAKSEASFPFNVWPWLGAVAVAGLLGLLLLKRKRTTKPPKVQRTASQVVAPVLIADSIPDLMPVQTSAPAPIVEKAAVQPAAIDLESVEIYIAYGRFTQARDMLQTAIQQAPENLDLRMKLLQVLAQMGDHTAFHAEEAKLLNQGGNAQQVAQLKSRYPVLGKVQPSSDESINWENLQLEPQNEASEPVLNLNETPLDIDWEMTDIEVKEPTKQLDNLHNLHDFPEIDLREEDAITFSSADDLLDSEPHKHGELLASLEEASACINQGNLEEAYRILKQIIENGDSKAKAEARELLALIA